MLRRSTILDEWARVRGFPAGFALPADRGLTTDEIERFARAIEDRTLRKAAAHRRFTGSYELFAWTRDVLREWASDVAAARKRLENE